MNKKEGFCEECRKDVHFTVIEKEIESTVKGEKYYFIGKEAHCVNCKTEIYIAEIIDFNLEQLNIRRKQQNE